MIIIILFFVLYILSILPLFYVAKNIKITKDKTVLYIGAFIPIINSYISGWIIKIIINEFLKLKR